MTHLREWKADANKFAELFARRFTQNPLKSITQASVASAVVNMLAATQGAGWREEINRQDFIMQSNVDKTSKISKQEEVNKYANDVFDAIQRYCAKYRDSVDPRVRLITRQLIVDSFLIAYGFKQAPAEKPAVQYNQQRRPASAIRFREGNMRKINEDFSELFDFDDEEDMMFADAAIDDVDYADQFDYLNDDEWDDYGEIIPSELFADEEISLYHESFKQIYDLARLSEGGPRKNMSQETIDTFVHQLLLIPDSNRRQEVVNEIFAKIADENQKAFAKSQKKLDKAETEVRDGLKENTETFLKTKLYQTLSRVGEPEQSMLRNIINELLSR